MNESIYERVPLAELQERLKSLRGRLDADRPDWDTALILGRVNQYYFTGTMQDGLLIVPRDGEAVFFVRRSYERAIAESAFKNIKPMENYREAAAVIGSHLGRACIETETIPFAIYHRISRCFKIDGYHPIEPQISKVRAVKSKYEIELIKEAGRIHKIAIEEYLPSILREGASEAELMSELYLYMVKMGYQGLTRFSMFGTESHIGILAFGTSSLNPTNFDGPDGNIGNSPAVPLNGSSNRFLKKGDLVFADIGCGFAGYHTDKTLTYMFGGCPAGNVLDYQRRCEDIMYKAANLLRPGVTPSEVYERAVFGLDAEFLENFMGYGKKRVPFLGHGIGLHTDEKPVIASGFDEPLEAGMVIALEPKVGIAGIGLVGTENTFLVSPGGGISLTGTMPGLIPVY